MGLIDVTIPVLQRGIHYLTSPYGMRRLNGVTKMHNGVDLVSYYNGSTTIDYVVAYADGTVTYNGFDGERGYYVIINHGSFETIYQHLRYSSILQVGMTVKAGYVVGLMGATGNATGAHLHFGVRVDGKWVDPMPYLVKEPTNDSWKWAVENGIVSEDTDPIANPTNEEVVSMLYKLP